MPKVALDFSRDGWDIWKGAIELRSCPEPNTGCWLWIRCLSARGYGQLHRFGKTIAAHRVSFAAFNGFDPGERLVCHRCDTPSCVNPDHLFLGTQFDNMRDAVRKGRTSNVKLTHSQVLAILASKGSCRAVGRVFGVSAATVSRVRAGRIWRHITSPDVNHA